MNKERCKEKHWWSGDPHKWKKYSIYPHDDWYERKFARECLDCGLMQVFSDYPNEYYRNAIKIEFDVRIEKWKKGLKEKKEQKTRSEQFHNQIEMDRLNRLEQTNPKESISQ